ncbi:dihydroorotase [Candidatus Aerophobetes bacterium]|nr:dihydroorotase [Candidatus Aerophobetes bacterium]
MSILIKRGMVVDPASHREDVLDILIEDKIIKKIGKDIKSYGAEVIDAREKIVIPGLVDLHTHLREPGREDEETIRTGTLAAAKGGFTTICCMPNTNPPIDNPTVVKYIYREAEKNGVVEVLPVGTISYRREGKKLSEMGRLKESGVVGFSDDGSWVVDSNLMRRALEYAKMFNLPIISHCEDPYLSKDGVMNEGYWSTVLGLPGIPAEAEEIAIFRDLSLARLTGSKLHIAHLSTRGGVELIRKAKQENIKVSCEVTPHHLALCDEAVKNFDTNTKVNPPLRTGKDIEALKDGLREGVIDIIATDHAPHTQEEKELEYSRSPFGIIGLETALSLVIKELVEPGILSFMEAIAKLTINPSRIIGIDRGKIREGSMANLAVVDLSRSWQVKEEEFFSLSKNSAFIGWTLPGKVEFTICKGKIVYSEDLEFLHEF